MQVIEPVETMQLICKRLISDQAKTIRLVPTMGALHAGHASLIKRAIEDKAALDDDDDCGGDGRASSGRPQQTNGAAQTAGRDHGGGGGDGQQRDSSAKRPVVVVSIFVNPLQFNDRDDFVKYPVAVERDLALCSQLGVDYVFMPKRRDLLAAESSDGYLGGSRKISTASMGSAGGGGAGGGGSGSGHWAACVTVRPPDEQARDLEGRARQNHFEGMLTIVCKLLNIVRPSRAYFGVKDYQQLVLVNRMVGDLNMATKICAVETVREPASNLPLSSRNGRLTSDQKQTAASLMFNALLGAKQALEDKCRRSTYDDSNVGPAPNFQLETILTAALVAAQSCSLVVTTTAANNDEDAPNVDYFEIRCAKDLSVIEFDRELNLYDCQKGCVERRLWQSGRGTKDCNSMDEDYENEAKILDARLLIAVWVAKVRLLDNMAVQLNL